LNAKTLFKGLNAKTLFNYSISIWGTWSFVWGAKPSKGPRGDGTGYIQATSLTQLPIPLALIAAGPMSCRKPLVSGSLCFWNAIPRGYVVLSNFILLSLFVFDLFSTICQ